MILPTLLFLVSSTISTGCLAFSLPTQIHSSYPWQRLTLRTGQPCRRPNHPVRYMVPDDKNDQSFASPTMNLSGDVRTPDGKTLTNDDIDQRFDRIFGFKDMFEESKNAVLKEVDEVFEPPTQKVKQFKAMSFAPPKPSPAITLAVEKPSKNLTGVDPKVTSICATISQQMYNATSIDSFDLIDKNDKTLAAEVIIFDDHGALNDLVPLFAVAVSGDVMILAWRGSQSIMDWASDFSAAPVTSCRWNYLSQYVKAHSGYASMVESDMATHEAALIKTIQTRKITQLVATGHSLAGGMAQVSHVFLEGQLQQQGSRWNKLLGKLTVRSIGFSAPMTIMSTMGVPGAKDPTNTFLQKISDHSCNIVYGPDVVPHATGDTTYVINVIEAIIPDVAKDVSWSWALRLLGIPTKLTDKVQDLIQNNEAVKNLLKVVVLYNHLGKIIHYAENSPNPVVLRDNQFQSASLPFFRDYGIEVPKRTWKDGKLYSVKDQLTNAHLFFPSALAYNMPKDKQGTK